MAKTTSLNFTQNLSVASTVFDSAMPLSVIAAAVTNTGTGATAGSITYTVAGGTAITTSTFTATVGTAGTIISTPIITAVGSYTAVPTTPNTPTPNTGTSNATFALTLGILQTLYTGATNDSVVKGISVASTDSSARNVQLWINTGTGGDKLLGTVAVAANSGNGTVAAVDLLSGLLIPALPYDQNGKRVLPLKTGVILKASVPAVTAGSQFTITVVAEEY